MKPAPNYFTQSRHARTVMAASLAAMAALTLSGCEDGPECLSGHTELVTVPVFNGKTTTIQTTSRFVCDKYEERASE
ncbi:hypothetical protein [Streptomyces globisporus]|uniref:hypothetical protein n=1 Tax=Streptomyces globisporus TaxID=1908 RepID=UPI0038134A90